jgi:cyanophycin synthetase
MAKTITYQLMETEIIKRNWSYVYFGANDRFMKVRDSKGIECLFRGTRPDLSSANGVNIAVNKSETIKFVERIGYRVAETVIINDPSELSVFLSKEKQIVVKPMDSEKSKGVTVGITSMDELYDAISLARKESSTNTAVAQKQLSGKLYRVLVIGSNVVAVSDRKAACVVGDGLRTVRELVNQLNVDPRRGDDSSFALQTINIDSVSSYVGQEALEAVLGSGEELRIGAIESVSAGGTAADATELIHESWSRALVRIAHELGLFVAGFDLITPDISDPMVGNFMPLLEVNSTPGLKIHQFPSEGESREIAPILLDAVFDLKCKLSQLI